jgi:hypothetical protein
MTVHPRNAISRRGDPSTSFEAEETITRNGTRDSQAQRVLNAVRKWPGRTSASLAYAELLDRYVVARRLSELEFLGLVKKGPPAISPNGRRGVTWHPTSPGEQGRLFEETPMRKRP